MKTVKTLNIKTMTKQRTLARIALFILGISLAGIRNLIVETSPQIGVLILVALCTVSVFIGYSFLKD